MGLFKKLFGKSRLSSIRLPWHPGRHVQQVREAQETARPAVQNSGSLKHFFGLGQ
jgi:hypothetical protein